MKELPIRFEPIKYKQNETFVLNIKIQKYTFLR